MESGFIVLGQILFGARYQKPLSDNVRDFDKPIFFKDFAYPFLHVDAIKSHYLA